MSWRDELQPASFRGVEFQVIDDQASFGRRTVLHEYPFRDVPYAEDLGRKAREFRISAIIIGDDYIGRRDALIDAVEAAGTGKLVHPQYGELDVSIVEGGVSIQHSTAEGGCSRISFACVETGDAKFPSAQTVTEDVVRDRADAASLNCMEAFTARFSFDGLPGWAQGYAIQQAQSFLDTVSAAVSSVGGIGANTGLLSIVSALSPQLATLLSSGMGFATQVRGLLSRLRGASTPATSVRVLASFAGFGADRPVILGTPIRNTVLANHEAMTELVRALVVAETAQAVADLEFDSYTDAVDVRDAVTERIDEVTDVTPSDALYTALVSLRAAVVADVAARGADLSRVVTITPPRTLPALVLAYQLYEDSAREDEIIVRNGIHHPGYVPGGQALEVLSE